ncbi:sepiapterin reductase [Schistocerca cancellata]|uniref:sepiapterin reductase n=1 Tax=Schistocerca cancellata TaxID=274614 RepID=UPI00211851AD|nr:sepiapterin reductase [Schistocerca cancellata]
MPETNNECVGGSAWGRRSLVVVTGASRGIGRAVALEAGRRVGQGSLMVLVARNADGLGATAEAVRRANAAVSVVCKQADLERDVAPDLLSDAVSQAACGDTADYEVAMIVHSAGSVGDLSEGTAQLADSAKWTSYLALNVSSAAVLTAQFLALLPQGDDGPRHYIINITSLAAVEPFPSLGYYCVGRAARQMYFSVLAAENASLAVLNYSPGVVDTDMVASIENGASDPAIRNSFSDMRKRGDIVSPEKTAARLAAVLETGAFQSGKRIDYYDLKD